MLLKVIIIAVVVFILIGGYIKDKKQIDKEQKLKIEEINDSIKTDTNKFWSEYENSNQTVIDYLKYIEASQDIFKEYRRFPYDYLCLDNQLLFNMNNRIDSRCKYFKLRTFLAHYPDMQNEKYEYVEPIMDKLEEEYKKKIDSIRMKALLGTKEEKEEAIKYLEDNNEAINFRTVYR